MTLGLPQTAILAFIRQQSQRFGKVEIEVVKTWSLSTLDIKSRDQVSITLTRLIQKSLILEPQKGFLSYINNPKNEQEFAKHITLSNIIVEMADP